MRKLPSTSSRREGVNFLNWEEVRKTLGGSEKIARSTGSVREGANFPIGRESENFKGQI